MRFPVLIAASSLLMFACDAAPEGPDAGSNQTAAAPAPAVPVAQDREAAARWDLQSSGEGVALALLAGSGEATVRLFCPAGEGRLLVNVPAFRPVASEERLSFGSARAVVALVADTAGDARRGGVSGTGAMPDDLAALVDGPVGVNYGYQNSGPHPAPAPDLARAFVAACREARPAPAAPNQAAKAPLAPVSACLMQGDERLDVRPLRAIGTEPFWGAQIEGRCVTYSHPDDQKGTRIWTRYTPAPGGGTWSGALGGARFELRTRAEPGCFDGMSDRRYPIAVDLLVNGERRRGCAEPL